MQVRNLPLTKLHIIAVAIVLVIPVKMIVDHHHWLAQEPASGKTMDPSAQSILSRLPHRFFI
jgi:hypothetical protein